MTKKKPMGIHISVVPSKREGKTYTCTLLRQSYRDKENPSKIRKITLANLSHLPQEAILLIKEFLKGETLVRANSQTGPLELVKSTPHGHVQAVMVAFQKLGLPSLIASKPSKERDLICALIASRILKPDSKLATTSWWHHYPSSLADEYPVIRKATSDDVYRAMDGLLKRQDMIQKKLAKRLLSNGSTILYDLSSSYFEGQCCPMAQYGYSRDGKPKKLQINYGLLCDPKGRPVAVNAYEGNIHDSQTLLTEIDRLKKKFHLSKVVVVGDRGMITGAKGEHLRKLGGVQWITALRKSSIQKMLTKNILDKLDETHLCEWQHPDFPGERLVGCYNKSLGSKLSHDREHLLQKTEHVLEELQSSLTSRKKKLDDGKVGIAVGRALSKFKVGKYFQVEIKNHNFTFERDADKITQDQQRDGIYVIRTSLSSEEKDSFECVRTYKSLAKVESAFRILKSELKVRPIYHWKPERVRSHLFLCMLAYYVEWHMREAWLELTFSDHDNHQITETRHPVHPAGVSDAALAKKQSKELPDGTDVCKFRVLLDSLSAISKCEYRVRYNHPSKHFDENQRRTFQTIAPGSKEQQHALNQLEEISDLMMP